jgi:hypothetical protein
VSRRNNKPWTKLSSRILDDRALWRLEAAHERIYWRLYALCGRDGVGDELRLSAADVAWTLRLDEEELQAALEELSGAGLLEVGEGAMRLVRYEEEQRAATAAERQKRSRASRSESQPGHGVVTKGVTDRDNGSHAPPRREVTGASPQSRVEQSKPDARARGADAAESAIRIIFSKVNCSYDAQADVRNLDEVAAKLVVLVGGWPAVKKRYAQSPDKLENKLLGLFARATHLVRQDREERRKAG